MTVLAFFPWLNVSEVSSIGRFHLIPYRLGKPADINIGASQKELDHILGAYFETATLPIQRATLLKVGRKAVCRDLKPKDIEDAFIFAELLAFSGLSAREFFGFGTLEYVNRDLYRLIVQRFRGLSGVAITTRRRDGVTSAYVAANAHRVMRPEHVHSPTKPPVDAPLIKALLRAWRKMPPKEWRALYGAILSFNLANTDSNEILPQMEIILMNVSIEQLLDSESNIKDIAKRFLETFSPKKPLRASLKPKVRKAQEQGRFKSVKWLRDVWIRDFFLLRGHVAHKPHADQYPAIWSLREHLLLGSFVIPILVKLRLKNLGYYVLSRDDRMNVDIFEKLCSRNLLDRPIKGGQWPWRKVLSDAIQNDWWDSARPQLAQRIMRFVRAR